MKLYAKLFAVVMICITIIYCFSKGENFTIRNTEPGSIKVQRIGLTVQAEAKTFRVSLFQLTDTK